jgi:hypothetical protein
MIFSDMVLSLLFLIILLFAYATSMFMSGGLKICRLLIVTVRQDQQNIQEWRKLYESMIIIALPFPANNPSGLNASRTGLKQQNTCSTIFAGKLPGRYRIILYEIH